MTSAYVVPTTILFTAGLAEADLILHKKPPVMKPIIGGFILGIGLYGLFELDTRLGSLFCVLLVVNAFLQHGVSVFEVINGKAVK